MTKAILSVLLITTILATSTLATSSLMVKEANAYKSQGTPAWKYGSATAKIVCGDRLCSEYAGGYESWKESQNKSSSSSKSYDALGSSDPKYSEKQMTQQQMQTHVHSWKTTTGTVTSSPHLSLGHEGHQIAILLPPSDKTYKGMVTYSASENIQLLALHGPLSDKEVKGQSTVTFPDGETTFALTFVDREDSMGTWMFAGNALAVHTTNPDPFTVSYSVSYMEKDNSENMTRTITSSQDPGIGHESHQLAIILPLNSQTYSGVLTYSASEPIQLVSLHGPLAEGEAKGQKTWTPDGKTKYGLTFVDREDSMGTWMFAGNALAVHTTNPEPFTVSYSVVAEQN